MNELGKHDAVDRLTAFARHSRVDFLSHYPSEEEKYIKYKKEKSWAGGTT
jgi:hypothetical protein